MRNSCFYDRLPKYMSLTDCCTYFGVSKYWLRRCIKEGRLIPIKMGNAFMIEVSALESLLSSSTGEAGIV